MEDELVSIDGILGWMKSTVENKIPISPGLYLDAASKLLILLSDLDDDLIDARMQVACARTSLLEQGKPVGAAKMLSEATEAYGTFLRLQAKRDRVSEMIRVAKLRTQLGNWDA